MKLFQTVFLLKTSLHAFLFKLGIPTVHRHFDNVTLQNVGKNIMMVKKYFLQA